LPEVTFKVTFKVNLRSGSGGRPPLWIRRKTSSWMKDPCPGRKVPTRGEKSLPGEKSPYPGRKVPAQGENLPCSCSNPPGKIFMQGARTGVYNKNI
jgi:hypothetical protein